MKYIKYIVLIISSSTHFLSGQNKNDFNKNYLSITNLYLNECIDLTKNCVGFTAPVSARALAYISIGFYECSVESQTNSTSLSSQLQGYERKTFLKNKNIFWPHVFNYFDYKIIKQLYANMPPSSLTKLKLVKDSIFLSYKKEVTKLQIKNSEIYADSLLVDIIKWMELDNGMYGYNTNFPKSYVLAKCKSCWEKTYPGYLNAVQPYWGKNRLMISSNNEIETKIKAPFFSTDTNSAFYKDAHHILLNYNINPIQSELIAEYWDDAAGYSGTPPGHLFVIAKQLVLQQNLEFKQALKLYTLLGISINDAIIVCWNQKYKHNLIRPVTYIKKYISPNFQSIIPTPSFPEFPSGHSMQSAAAGEILKYFFTDSLKITDIANEKRVDIVGKKREFNSVSKMVEEISLSRFYGGIHFMNTLNLSVDYGKKIGQNTITKINFNKE